MAGVVKGVQQVVSSCPASDGSQCDAFSSDHDNFAFAAEVNNTNNDLLALSPSPTEDDLSLQDLIDSELALRISSPKSPADINGVVPESNGDLLLDLDNHQSSGDLSKHQSNGDMNGHQSNGDLNGHQSNGDLNGHQSNGDLNGHHSNGDLLLDLDSGHQTNGEMLLDLQDQDELKAEDEACGHMNGVAVADFLEQERSHTELVDNSLSLSLSSSNADMAPLCSGEGDDLDVEMTSELGSEAPADSDFSPNHPLAEDEGEQLEPDEATLAEDLSMASDRSQERTGSLLDLDPLRPDSPPGCGPGPGLGTGQGTLGTGGTGVEEGEGRGYSSPSPLAPEPELGPDSAGSSEESRVLSAAAAAEAKTEQPQQPQQHQEQPSASIAAAETATATATAYPDPDVADYVAPAILENVDGPLEESASDPSAPCVVANPVVVTDNSMDGFAATVAGPGAVPSGGAPGDPPASGQGFEDGFETWSTVEEAVAHSDFLAETHTDAQVEAEVESKAPLSTSSDTETVSETSEKKSVSKKKKTSDGAESTKKKTKKTKKSEEKENISVKSSFSKFDQLSKKTVLHVRSVDASKVQKQFNESASTSPEAQSNCKACGKQVFVMEQIKAEKALWHKNCFRCKECSKQLTVDTYSSNEGDIYCKPHFRELFKPKAVVEDSPEPTSDKPDLGLEELSSLNVKSRFQVFEKSEENKSSEVEKSGSAVNVKRSASILSKLAKFQAKGMDIGVTDDSLNGIPYEESSTSSEEEDDEDENEENGDIVKSRRTARERPMSFSKMEDVKSRWETGSAAKKEERREERKQEIQSIRSRLFMGKQGKMKEMYEQAVKESEQPAARRGAEVRSEKAKSIKEKFERGETLVSDEDEELDKKMKDEDLGVFEAGISKKSRSLFLELDASAAKTVQQNPSPRPAASKDKTSKREVHLNHQISSEVVKASDKVEDVQVETADISSRFKFFETYKAPEKQKKTFRITPPREGQVKMESPDREVYRDPDVIRGDDPVEGDELQHSMTTSKMLSIFRQMEEKAQKEDVPDGPKPLKCFTPPPDYKPESGSSDDDRSDEDDEEDEDEEDEEEDDDGVVRSSMKTEDEFLKAAKEAAKAKTLRAKFEHWEEQENNINSGGGNINPTLLESEHESIESTKSLRARFEALKSEAEAPKEKPRPKVNRFVEIQTSCAEYCDSCEKKVYPLEKVETGGKLFHRGCFRCMQCSCILRMESYTLNNGKLYCIPHFKQLFISKGNYDEGFGLDQHKRKWNSSRENGDILLNGIDANGNNH